ncbi:MAG: 50S ribosomal protein L10 [Eubacteriaceae bacterium]|nr:50S ribosomal protein L10 [Eubacteriaceae bacterium]
MASPKILESKKLIVAEITEKMREAKAFVIVDYKGINVEQVSELRTSARNAGITYKIYKNTFMRFAARELGYDGLVEHLEGPSAIVFSDDEVAPAKLVSDFVREHRLPFLAFKVGIVDGNLTTAEDLAKLAQLPSKEALLAKAIGSINAPIAKFVYLIDAIRKQAEETQAAS